MCRTVEAEEEVAAGWAQELSAGGKLAIVEFLEALMALDMVPAPVSVDAAVEAFEDMTQKFKSNDRRVDLQQFQHLLLALSADSRDDATAAASLQREEDACAERARLAREATAASDAKIAAEMADAEWRDYEERLLKVGEKGGWSRCLEGIESMETVEHDETEDAKETERQRRRKERAREKEERREEEVERWKQEAGARYQHIRDRNQVIHARRNARTSAGLADRGAGDSGRSALRRDERTQGEFSESSRLLEMYTYDDVCALAKVAGDPTPAVVASRESEDAQSQAAKLLAKLLAHPDPRVRIECCSGVARAVQIGAADRARIDRLLTIVLRNDPSKRVKQASAQGLRIIENSGRSASAAQSGNHVLEATDTTLVGPLVAEMAAARDAEAMTESERKAALIEVRKALKSKSRVQ